MPSRYIWVTWEEIETEPRVEEIITAKCIQAANFLEHSLEMHCHVRATVTQGKSE